MKYIYQERFGECFNACIASILDLNYDNIPKFYDLYNKTNNFYIKVDEWLNDRGYKRIAYGPSNLKDIYKYFKEDDYNIMTITFKDQKEYGHALVTYRGLIIHNPCVHFYHPSGYDYDNCYYNRIIKK